MAIEKSEYKKKDEILYDAWKQNPNKQTLSTLVVQLHPLIYAEVQRQSGTLPPQALLSTAKAQAVKAIMKYDGTKGAALSTFVTGYLQKVRRTNYTFQNAVRLPENMQLSYHTYDRAVQNLTDKFNREPTDEELSKELGWSKPQVFKFKNSLYADLIESSSQRPAEVTRFNEQKILLDHILDSLSEEEKTIWKYSKDLSATDLADKLGVNINRLNYLKSKLKNKVMSIKQNIGYY